MLENKEDSDSIINEILIGHKVWTAENLNVKKFQNGESIPYAETDEQWVKAGEKEEPAYCYYDYNPANGEKYGKLYNWYAVNDKRGLAPKGWFIPTDEDWLRLVDYLGEDHGTKLKNSKGWEGDDLELGTAYNGTNESGFSGLPGGSKDWENKFSSMGYCGIFWTSTEEADDSALARDLDEYSTEFVAGKENGHSVRCIKGGSY